jgi:GT2 family glycosyltransferase
MPAATNPPLISVLIVAYRSGGTLARCLAALNAQTFDDFEVVLLDNASGDGLAARAASEDPSIRLLEMDSNLGFAAGNNRAADAAEGRWLVLLNPDAYAAPDLLYQLVQVAEERPEAACFTARQVMAQDQTRLDGLGDAMTGFGFPFRGGYGLPDDIAANARAAEVFSPCGAAMMIDRALFIRMGGFDERFFCYCEDVDLGYRLRLKSQRVVLAPRAVVAHEGSVSTGGRRSDFSMYHGVRNRLWVYVKNTPPLLLALTLIPHLVLTGAWWAAAVLRGEGVAVTRALRDAVRGLGPMLASRRELQRRRRAGSLAIARMMLWDPLAIARRRPKLRRF